mmetsp:Transcript_18485/g.28366  ORF Transcript_18485/g.28366 Transcript_18485/m.28366 type:complete len:197 (-) Transcript_18485:1202-1792(-)
MQKLNHLSEMRSEAVGPNAIPAPNMPKQDNETSVERVNDNLKKIENEGRIASEIEPENRSTNQPKLLDGANPAQRPGMPIDTGGDGDNMADMDRINKLAEFFATNGDYQSAIEHYVKMITIDSENGPAWTALGHCYLLVEDLQNSFNAYQRALYSLEDIKDPQLWYGIGILYEKFESYDHAISALIAVLKMSPNFY